MFWLQHAREQHTNRNILVPFVVNLRMMLEYDTNILFPMQYLILDHHTIESVYHFLEIILEDLIVPPIVLPLVMIPVHLSLLVQTNHI